MYYNTITNKELQYFHNRPVHNFTVKLSQMLTSPLFQVEEIITNSIYKIYPLFYTNEITSSNANDRILDNKCIICQKTEDETYLTFISDANSEIVDYSEYGNYYEIGDNLSESQFNAYISLLKQNIRHTGDFRISQGEIQGSYGTYEFNIENATIIDNGIVITDETISAQPKVKLTDNVFRWSSYILKLEVIHYTGVNILDDTTSDFKVVETLEIELTPNEWVNIPVESLEQDYIISLDVTVEIQHNKPEIHMITGLQVNATPQIIQSGENTDITAELLDTDGLHYDLTDGIGKTVYFYEVLTPTFTLNAEPNIIQTGEHSEITCKVKDEDGSIAKNTKVYFYERLPYKYYNDGTDLTTLTIPSDASVTVEDGALKITTSTNGEKKIAYNYNLNATDNFICECEVAKLGTVQSVAMYGNDSTTANGCWFAYDNATNKWNGAILGSTFTGVDTGTLAVGDKIKIKQENGVITLYHNDAVIYSKTANLGSNFKIGHYTNKDRVQYIKNIKITDLSEE